jgi:hypothetical protein
MVSTKLFFVSIFLLQSFFTFSQNLLNTSTWSVGYGSVTGFTKIGGQYENKREYGIGPMGTSVILWKAIPDSFNNADGGWNTGWISTNHNNSYRFSVWIKKTNSNHGTTYLGFYANNNGSLLLNNSYHSNPYFWYGDLPMLNRWYLIVGYVHKSSHTGIVHNGGIYDGVTGTKIKSITDFKLKNTVTAIRHRSYLYYDTNTLDSQYFFDPRIDVINGSEPSIDELLNKNNNATLNFEYDAAGNQVKYYHCLNGTCYKQKRGVYARISGSRNDNSFVENTEQHNEEILQSDFKIYPNPTSGLLNLHLHNLVFERIELYDINAKRILQMNTKNKEFIEIDLSAYPTGTYLLRAQQTDGQFITRKIIKN